MTVSELIKELKKLEQDKDIGYFEGYQGYTMYISKIALDDDMYCIE
jgi:hypothetical protein